MAFIRQYWIAGLVLLLVAIHAIIIGYVRAEATRIKITATNEIPLGLYYVRSADKAWMSQLRIHVLVPPEKRLAARATMEHHRWYLHEAIEEKLRQLDAALLEDPVLLEIKEQVKVAVNQALREEIVEQVLVNDRVDIPINSFKYQMPSDIMEPEPIYTTTPVPQAQQYEEVEKT